MELLSWAWGVGWGTKACKRKWKELIRVQGNRGCNEGIENAETTRTTI